jgi:hypothetical protein
MDLLWAIVAGGLTALVAFALRGTLAVPALTRTNYAGRAIATAGGVAAVAGFAVALGGAALFDLHTAGRAADAALAVFGFAAIGLFDDVVGTHAARGFRGHLAALREGRLTSGLLKLIVGLAVATIVAGSLFPFDAWRRVPAALIIAGCANVANQLDLAPARAWKASFIGVVLVVLAGASIPTGTGMFVVAMAALVPFELREDLMIGDTGANALGAAVGVAIAHGAHASPIWLVAIAAVVVGLNAAGELTSFSRVIDSVPPLRAIDRLGRQQ